MNRNDDRASFPQPPPRLAAANNYLGQFLVLTAAGFFSLSLAFLLVVAGERFFNVSYVEPGYFEVSQDELDRRFEEVDPEIKSMANRLGFTAEAKQTLYKYQPEVFENDQDENYICSDRVEPEEEISIAGCLDIPGQKIYVIAGEGAENTLVHEFLHAAYEEMSFNEPEQLEQIDQLLEETYAENRPQLEPILALYDDLHDHDNDNLNQHLLRSELHSWVGAAVKDMPPRLEAHYGRYFKDRQVIIDVYLKHRSGFF